MRERLAPRLRLRVAREQAGHVARRGRLTPGRLRPRLGQLDALVGLDSVVRVVKVVGFVASAPDFTGQPAVVNGASELLGDVFGDVGTHARSAVGVASLPLDAPVEVELVVEVEPAR